MVCPENFPDISKHILRKMSKWFSIFNVSKFKLYNCNSDFKKGVILALKMNNVIENEKLWNKTGHYLLQEGQASHFSV